MVLTLIQRHLTGIETLTESNYSTWEMKLQIVLGFLNYDFLLTKDKPIIDPTDYWCKVGSNSGTHWQMG